MEQQARDERVSLLISNWFKRVREVQSVHYTCMRRFSRLHYLLGIPALVLSTAVGTAVIASLENEPTGRAKIIWGLLSVLSAVLGALQTFLGFSQRAEKHRQTGAGYGAVIRRIELLDALSHSEKEIESELQTLKDEMDNLAEHAPGVPFSIAVGIWGNPLRKARQKTSRQEA